MEGSDTADGQRFLKSDPDAAEVPMMRNRSSTREPPAAKRPAGAPRRPIEMPVHPRDGLVVARITTIICFAVLAFVFRVGDNSVVLAVLLLGLAAAQPMLALGWSRPEPFRQAQMFSDIVSFAVFAIVAPEYFWLSLVVLAALLSNHAVMASLRWYSLTAVLSLATIAASGAFAGVDHWERGVLVAAVLAVGHGYMGHRTRVAASQVRDDLHFAIGEAGGLAHLTEIAGGVVDVVGDVEQLVGWSREEWLAMDHRTLIHPDDLEDFWFEVGDLREGMMIDRTARVRTATGEWIWFRDMSRVVMHGHGPHLRGFSIDVTAAQAGLVRVATEASTDALTGLRNRRSLLAELVLREHRSGHHLVMIDLNRFKDVNDSLGHEAGDELLTIVSQRLAAGLRPDDILARLGGDEFAVLVEMGPGAAAVEAMVDRFAFEVARPVEISGVGLVVTMAAGIVVAEAGSSDASTMLRRADNAMYEAKRQGLRSMRFDADMEERSNRRAVLSAGLADALDDGDLQLHFQPIVDVATGGAVAVEGLARWDHPVFGLLHPATFLEVTLMSEASGSFTRVMVQHAIAALGSFAAAEVQLAVAVNVPVNVFQDADFASWVREMCDLEEVDASLLVFEIAERDIHDTGAISAAIECLVGMGITISIAGFGAGHATFERLRWRNVEQLKLDRSVVRHAIDDPRERAILRSVLDLADELGYDVVAEGVETQEQLELLSSLGCRLAQGYLFASSMSVDEVIAYVAAHPARRAAKSAPLS